MRNIKRGSRWAALIAALGFVGLGFAGPAAAEGQTVCFEHGAQFNDGPGGHGSSNGFSVTLNPFNPAWEQDHWESITVRGTTGLWFTQDHPPAGVYPAPGGVLTSWRVCKGYDHPVVIAATTTAGASSVELIPPTAIVVSTTLAPAGPADSTATSVATAESTSPGDVAGQRLPETGRTGLYLLLAAGFAALSIGGILIWVRRTPS
jgi:LPXTG-motif cell wall-anchored protein